MAALPSNEISQGRLAEHYLRDTNGKHSGIDSMRFYLSLCRFARHLLLLLLWRGTGDRLGLYVPATHMRLFSVRLWYLPGRTSSAGSPSLLQ